MIVYKDSLMRQNKLGAPDDRGYAVILECWPALAQTWINGLVAHSMQNARAGQYPGIL
ncbi:MAG: hypothetical protein JRI70_05065 [Deltaproteobacteria bacterium]|nr:hypothetical protein [Deltaproteobacteria bacterium]MBW2259676.1 hypothetical protein [Deltaproteobacteria bacterium]